MAYSQGWFEISRSRHYQALRGENGSLRGSAKLLATYGRQRVEVLEANDMRREEMLDAERNARMAAQRAAVVKDEFLATLSHELRTPLNAILGWTQVLKYKGLPAKEEFQRGMEVIERSTRAQAQLIDDLLDLSRIISGRVRLDVRQLALIDVVKGAIAIAEPAIEAKGIRLETVLDPGGGIISGDPARLQQILWNLLSNATKFTPRGGRIQVVLQRVNSHMEVNVSDTESEYPPVSCRMYSSVFPKRIPRLREIMEDSDSAWLSQNSWSSCTAGRWKRKAPEKDGGLRSV